MAASGALGGRARAADAAPNNAGDTVHSAPQSDAPPLSADDMRKAKAMPLPSIDGPPSPAPATPDQKRRGPAQLPGASDSSR